MGLAARAGRLASGLEAAEAALRRGEARALIVAGDAGPVRVEDLRKRCEAKRVPMFVLGDRESLGRSIGRSPRVAVAVTDANLAAGICALLGAGRPGPRGRG